MGNAIARLQEVQGLCPKTNDTANLLQQVRFATSALGGPSWGCEHNVN